MKLHLSRAPGLYQFTGYGPGYLLVNQERHETSLIVTPDQLLLWNAEDINSLQPDHLAPLLELKVDIVLLGSGNRHQFPQPTLIRPFAAARIGLEVMDSYAACRTFNILMAEGRKVAAAIILTE